MSRAWKRLSSEAKVDSRIQLPTARHRVEVGRSPSPRAAFWLGEDYPFKPPTVAWLVGADEVPHERLLLDAMRSVDSCGLLAARRRVPILLPRGCRNCLVCQSKLNRDEWCPVTKVREIYDEGERAIGLIALCRSIRIIHAHFDRSGLGDLTLAPYLLERIFWTETRSAQSRISSPSSYTPRQIRGEPR